MNLKPPSGRVDRVALSDVHLALSSRLARGFADLGLAPDPAVLQRMAVFLQLLARWNRTHNLTAIDDPVAMVSRHILDSLSIHPHIRGDRLLDIGTGGGFPGLPLALCFPRWRVIALDSNGKKIAFIRHAAQVLGLDNVQPIQARVEDFRPAQAVTTLVARAVGSAAELLALTDHLLIPPARLIHMKGQHPVTELAQLTPQQKARTKTVALTVPGLDAQRHLIITDL